MYLRQRWDAGCCNERMLIEGRSQSSSREMVDRRIERHPAGMRVPSGRPWPAALPFFGGRERHAGRIAAEGARMIYKIMSAAEWTDTQQSRVFLGSAADR